MDGSHRQILSRPDQEPCFGRSLLEVFGLMGFSLFEASQLQMGADVSLSGTGALIKHALLPAASHRSF
jgi:hypothetical protein